MFECTQGGESPQSGTVMNTLGILMKLTLQHCLNKLLIWRNKTTLMTATYTDEDTNVKVQGTAFAIVGWNQALDRRVLSSIAKSTHRAKTSARMANKNVQYPFPYTLFEPI